MTEVGRKADGWEWAILNYFLYPSVFIIKLKCNAFITIPFVK